MRRSQVVPIHPISNPKKQKSKMINWAIVVHGGYGNGSRQQLLFVKKFTRLAANMLKKGKPSLNVVGWVIYQMESSGLFNAGIGSVENRDKEVEMDACIMRGRDGRSGTVTAIKNVKHPIDVARILMTTNPAIYVLTSGGAYKFAMENNIKRYQFGKNRKNIEEDAIGNGYGTVGCVCVDTKGWISSATSTGGLKGKVPGRVGDVGVVGAGTFATKKCGVSCSGTGEYFIHHMVAKSVCDMVKSGLSLKKSTKILDEDLLRDEGGFIGVDKNYNVIMTPRMSSYSLSSRTEVRVTGLGLFESIEINPSDKIARYVRFRLNKFKKVVDTQTLNASKNSVDFYFGDLKIQNPVVLIHFGLDRSSKNIKIETESFGGGKRQKTNFDLEIFSGFKTKFVFSTDAGKGMCNYLYHKSLKFTKQRMDGSMSIFVHVPDWEVEKLTPFFVELYNAIVLNKF